MESEKLRVGLLFGGQSGEHEVSITSAKAIASALSQNSRYDLQPFYIQKDGLWCNPTKSQAVLQQTQAEPSASSNSQVIQWQLPIEANQIDVWFPVLHGPNGEDGTVQGLLQLMQKPYVGNGVLASAVGMDKILMKSLFAQAGLAQVKYVALSRWQWQQEPESWGEYIETELGYPCFVKPSNLGSSVGISKVRDLAQLEVAIASAIGYDSRIIVEQGVTAREIECAVLGNDQPQASIVGEITYKSDFYDYETKYTAGMAELIIPANLPSEVIEAVQAMSVKAFQTLAGSGLARVDFFYVESTATVLINEINTLPGFTALSMYPKLWEYSGIPFADLCDRLIDLALEKSS
ncbi:D-alanine--D-alanine ligase family protein [Tumidithrix elongata RA019]|uniref:D-alanine--D-alanine ligase n=1 Tax=Tumidithrix elongata BACA0141 TaxID=2716417 RepID=A0AAW9Q4W3_9CYAN|nr:D-alanine--D-alanine ligase family protein [Tumidithrix elongata RA019]